MSGEVKRIGDEIAKLRGVFNVTLDELFMHRQKKFEEELDNIKGTIGGMEHRLTVQEVELKSLSRSIDKMNKVLIGLVMTTLSWLIVQILSLLKGGVHP